MLLAVAATATATRRSTGATSWRAIRAGPADARARRRTATAAPATTPPAGTSCSREPGAAGLRAGPVRPPAVRAVLLGHDRAAEGDRPRPRRHPASSTCKILGLTWDIQPGDRPLWFTTTAWMMWNALISALLQRALGRAARRQPRLAGPVAQWRAGAGDRRDAPGRQPRRSSWPAARRACSRARPRPAAAPARSPRPARRCPPRASTGSTSSSAPTSCSTARGGTDVCCGYRRRRPAAAGLPRARSPAARSAIDVAAFDGTARRSVGELGELVDPRRRCPSMPVVLERPRRRALPRRLLRHVPGRLAPRATGCGSPTAAAA